MTKDRHTLKDVARGLSTLNLEVDLRPYEDAVFAQGPIGHDKYGCRVVCVFFPAKDVPSISRGYLEKGARKIIDKIPPDGEGGDNR